MNEQESYVKNLKIEHTRLLAAHQKVKDQNLELRAANAILRLDETHKMMATSYLWEITELKTKLEKAEDRLIQCLAERDEARAFVRSRTIAMQEASAREQVALAELEQVKAKRDSVMADWEVLRKYRGAKLASAEARVKELEQAAMSSRDDLQTSIDQTNKYGRIIDQMFRTLEPDAGESNVEVAVRRMSELNTLKRLRESDPSGPPALVSPWSVQKEGGEWLAAVRRRIQSRFINGERIIWGSTDTLQPPARVIDLEEIVAYAVAVDRNARAEASRSKGSNIDVGPRHMVDPAMLRPPVRPDHPSA